MPTYVYPLILAVLAVGAGFLFAHRHGHDDEPNALVSKILYAVAVGCVVIAIATYWLWNNY